MGLRNLPNQNLRWSWWVASLSSIILSTCFNNRLSALVLKQDRPQSLPFLQWLVSPACLARFFPPILSMFPVTRTCETSCTRRTSPLYSSSSCRARIPCTGWTGTWRGSLPINRSIRFERKFEIKQVVAPSWHIFTQSLNIYGNFIFITLYRKDSQIRSKAL